MVEPDLATTIVFPIITLIVAIAIPVGLFSMRQFGKTSEGTLTGSIKIEGLRNNVEQVEDTMDKGFNKIETLLNKRDEESKVTTQRLWEAINQNSSRLTLFEYRLKQLERIQAKRTASVEDDNNNG